MFNLIKSSLIIEERIGLSIVDNTLKELVGSVDYIGASQTYHGLWPRYRH